MIKMRSVMHLAEPGSDKARTLRSAVDADNGPRFAATLALSTRSPLALPPALPMRAVAFTLQSLRSATAAVKGAERPVHERALALRAYRQEVLASNIANADTPGYKAVDFDINQALQNGDSGSAKPQLQFRVPEQGSADNNTVELDNERVQFAANALMYEFSVDRVKGHYKEMDDLLKSMPF